MDKTQNHRRRPQIMVGQIIRGETVDVNDTTTYNNGVKVVPTFLIEPEVVVRDDIQSRLVDTGFITIDQVTGL